MRGKSFEDAAYLRKCTAHFLRFCTLHQEFQVVVSVPGLYCEMRKAATVQIQKIKSVSCGLSKKRRRGHKMKKKKIVALLTACMLMTGMFTGCGSSQQAAGS